MKQLESERLILREFTLEDLDDFYDYCRLETVGPKAGWAVHENKSHSLKILEGFLQKKDVWALVYKTNNKVIGSVGLHRKENQNGEELYEVGYVLSTPYEGQGLMTEAVKRVLEFAFNEMMLNEVFICHFLENHKSRRVIEKCNFEYLHLIEYQTVDFGKKVSKFYHLTRDQFNNNREETK